VRTGRSQFRRRHRNLPGTRHANQVDGIGSHAMLKQRALRAVDQGIDNARIPATGNDREATVGMGTHGATRDVHGIGHADGVCRPTRQQARSLADWLHKPKLPSHGNHVGDNSNPMEPTCRCPTWHCAEASG